MPSSKRSRARRVLGVVGTIVFVSVTFVMATAAAAVIHLDVPATRRLVASQVTGVLKDVLAGDVRIEHIGRLGLRGIEGVRVRVRDPEGVQVLHVDDVRVRIRVLEVARSALFGKGPIVIDVPCASIGNVDANLDSDAKGDLRMASAFSPKKPTPPKPNEPPGRGVRVEAPEIRLGHAWVHGRPPGAMLVDADVSELSGRLHLAPNVVRADLDRVRLVTRAMPRHLDPRGTIGGHFQLPAANGHGMDIKALFDGDIGGMPTTAEGQMIDKKIDARVDTRDDTGASAQAIVSELASKEAVSLHAELYGELPHVQAKVKLAYGNATVDAGAVVETGPTTRVTGTVSARHIDLAAIAGGAPESDLGLDAQGHVALHDGAVNGEASIDTLPGRIDKESMPRAEVRGIFAGRSARVRGRIHEKTMPTEVAVDVSPRSDGREGREIAVAVRSRIPDLHRVPKVGSISGGSAEIDASARLTFPEKTIDAKAEVTVHEFSKDGFGIGVVKTQARAKGTLDHPVVDAEVHAKQLLTGTIPIASVDARARVEVAGKAVSIRDARVEAVRPGQGSISASARLVRIDGPALRVEEVEVLGLGDPIHAEASKDAREIRGKIDAPRIDLGLVARLARLENDVRKGTLGLRGEATMKNGDLVANVHAEVADLEVRRIKDARAVADVSVDGRDIALDARAELDSAGRFAVRTENVVIAGKASDPKSWKRAHGRIHLDSELDMEKTASLLPPRMLPFTDLRGYLTVQGRVGRDAEDAPPEVQLHVHTNGLLVAGPAREEPPPIDGILVELPPKWRSSDVDLGLDIRSDGMSGLTTFALRTTDRHGPIFAIDAKTILPYDEIVADPAVTRDRLFAAPLSAKVVIPSRRLDQLPAVLGVKDLQGAIEAELDASGTILDPRVHFVARGRGVRAPAMPRGLRTDSDLVLDYDGSQADLAMKMRSKGKELLDVSSHVEARVRDVIQGNGAPLAWKASGRVRLATFPLETLPQLADRRVKGDVSGELTLDDLHTDARVNARIDVSRLSVGKAEYESGTITLTAGRGTLTAKARLEQKDGFLDASATTGLAWGAEVAPKLDDTRPARAKLLAKSFRAAAIQPFVESVLPALDGRIDADASARLVPGQTGATMDGKITFRDGTVQLEVLGDELRRVQADITLTPDGTIKVENVSARGTSGELYANATVKLDGLRVADATANVRIPDRRALDVAVAGQPIGQISGSIAARANRSPDGKTTELVVDVPRLTVVLPQVTKVGVQQLDRKGNIRIGVYRDRRTFVMLPLDREDTVSNEKKAEASHVDIDVRLGQIVLQRGNQARVTVTGNPKVSVGAETEVTGQINAVKGWIDVQGKKFEIERGTITFNGESPPNPVVVLTAGWTAADGTRCFADFIGPVKSGRVTLRSEPPRPKNEILALILFGTADGANPAPAPPGQQADGTMRAAVALGGGFAAQGLTEALDDLAGIQATARIDTTLSSNPRPEIEFQLAPKVTVGFAHVIGTPPITEPDKNLATVDYRFHKNWSLETTVGDRGKAMIDAVWQKRY